MNLLCKQLFFIWMCFAGALVGSAASAVATDWNVTVLDQLLASVPAGQAFVQIGDMQVPVSYLQAWRNKLAGGQQSAVAFSGTLTTWPGGNVYYAFDASVSASNQKAFLDAVAEWATFANLHFIQRSTQANYILVTNNPTLSGGNSFVGMVGGAQLLQIGPTSWNRATLCHEVGHALGLVHEHQRSDRDSFVTIVTNNILAGNLADFVKLTDSQNKSAYDFLSVMHYARNAFAINPVGNTIVPLPAYTNFLNIMGARSDPVLSASDRAGMALVYGAGPGVTNVVTNTLDGGPGSLRAALYYAYDHPGTTISFNIPVSDAGFSNSVFNILPSDGLPGLWGNTTLDATTEPVNSNPSGPEILLNGALCHTGSSYPSGLQFRGTNSVARGFVINNFPEYSVLMDGSNCVGNTVSGCYLGVDPTGTLAVTNGVLPVQISGGATSNLVGGATVAARNVIGGSVYQGLAIRDAGTKFNSVQGNYVGLNATGTAALPNQFSGVEIFNAASANVIGPSNVLSGNWNYGVSIDNPGANGNVVQGNFIGLNAAGSAAVPNGYGGVGLFNGAQSNLVGGYTLSARNVIGGNLFQGVIISYSGSTGNRVVGNYIGLNAAGTAGIPNGYAGVEIGAGAQNNFVGGPGAGAGNVISGNSSQGVAIDGSGTTGNSVQGNIIGLNPAGTMAIGNNWAGVNFFGGATANLVGGTVPGAGNVISGNNAQGVLFQDAGTSGNFVQGNLIGLNASGTAAISNAWSGVEIYNGPSGNVIGGYSARNFISGNGNYGVIIDYGSGGNFVQGNTIGLNAANSAAVPNGYANVAFYLASSNTLGGTSVGAANLISGSSSDGVQVLFSTSTNNTIRGNSIFGSTGTAILDYSGGNNNLAAPTLSSAVVTTNLVVTGTYSGAVGAHYLIDFYADAPPAASAEAMTYLGFVSVTGTGSFAPFAANFGARLPAGRAVTATATDPFGNTSPLSTGVAVTMTSSVNDGIPDAWRAKYFGGSGTTTNSQSNAFADPDHDGMSNYQEFLAGTNPTNVASALKLTMQNPVTSTNAVGLSSANGTIYRIWSRDDLIAGNWAILADQVIGTGTNIFFADPAVVSASKHFYRAEVLW